ncbi:hypothetical protein AVEN_107468-1 [Araneus ventricosus]|uniref:Uncharacterized protein n=1 Tax=Araneus ventricosus TaxID=182803 RepID=A0A4Y2J022_ARAVE|nr:hypothetical protein AVEN_107468-1 [Araneus ventricosus]
MRYLHDVLLHSDYGSNSVRYRKISCANGHGSPCEMPWPCHIAILVCNKVAAVLLCKLAVSLTRQDSKFITSLQQVSQTTKSPCVELAVNLSCKFIAN